MLASVLLSVLTAAYDDPVIRDHRSLVAAIREANPIKDMSFMFEGSWNYVEHEGPDDGFTFQGSYSYRLDRDPSTDRAAQPAYLDLYMRSTDDSGIMKRETHAILNDDHDVIYHNPDRQPSPESIQKGRGGFMALRVAGSPDQVLFHRYFNGWLIDNERFAGNVKIEGWESIGGRKCLRFVIDSGLGTDREGRSYQKYWMDIEHGAHVVKYEHHMFGNLAGRIDDVRLELVEVVDGREIWFPVEAHYYSYLGGSSGQLFSDTPTIHMAFYLVRDTFRANQGLPDSRFSVFHRPGVPQSDRLRQLEREFRSQRTAPANFEEVRERLESNLALANEQARELEASSLARNPSWTSYLPYSWIVLGVVLLSVSGVLLWRRR